MGVMLDCYESNDLWIKEWSGIWKSKGLIWLSLQCTYEITFSIIHTEYWMNNHQPRSHPGHDNPIPMCLMSRLFVGLVTIVTHRVCYYWDQSSGGEGLVIPRPLPGNYGKLDYGAGAGQGSQCAKHCHCHLCYVKWFDPSYDYLANFSGLIFIFSN